MLALGRRGLDFPDSSGAQLTPERASMGESCPSWASVPPAMGSLIKKRRKRMRKKKHKKMLKRTRWQRRAAGK